MTHGEYIRERRKAAGIRQGQLAERMGLEQHKLSKSESGVRAMSEAEYVSARQAILDIEHERKARELGIELVGDAACEQVKGEAA